MSRWILVSIAFLAGAALGAGVVLSRLDHYPDGMMRWHHANVKVDYFPPTPVLVAASDLPAGTVLRDELVSQRGLPDQFVDRAMLEPKALPSLRGLTVLEPLEAGEPLRRTVLAKPGSIDAACAALARAVNAKQPEVARARLADVSALVPR